MYWWIWAIIGCLLMGLELLIPSDFFILFFGLSGVVTGVLTNFEVLQTIEIQLLFLITFSVFLLLCYRILYKNKRRVSQESLTLDKKVSLYDEVVIVESKILPGETGRGSARGTTWNLRNIGDVVFQAGDKVRVVRTEGITLEAKK